MGYREARELARIRQQLRERLMTHSSADTGAILERLRRAAENEQTDGRALQTEYERWRVRFELLSGFAVNNDLGDPPAA